MLVDCDLLGSETVYSCKWLPKFQVGTGWLARYLMTLNELIRLCNFN